MIAARQIAFGKAAGKGLSAKDYIQDGLIEMYDGIENRGWDTHFEGDAAAWTDLIQGKSIRKYSQFESSNSRVITFDESGPQTGNYERFCFKDETAKELLTSGKFTIEACAKNIYMGGKANINSGVLSIGGTGMFDGMNIIPYGGRASKGWTSVALPRGKVTEITNDGLKNGTWGFTSESVGLEYAIVHGGKYSIPQMYWDFSAKVYYAGGYILVGNTNTTTLNIESQWLLHSIRLYNRALTAEEIAHNYKIDKARFGL